MDTRFSSSEVAEQLGCSSHAVIRRAGASGRGEVTDGGHWRFSRSDVAWLRAEFGVTPRSSLSRSEVQVLAALSRRPQGVLSTRALAYEAGLSPTATGKALARLIDQRLATTEQVTLAAGRARRCTVILANPTHPDWESLAPVLRGTKPKRRAKPAARHGIPDDIAHLFWNSDWRALDVAHDGPYIARRILTSSDANALAWAATNVSADAWKQASKGRGIDPARKALARNLAAAP